MIVPRYWAEAREQVREDGRQFTMRRFGWSDRSESEAEQMATERVREALERIRAGEKLPHREPKIPYNGAQGVPIREEIVEKHGDVVITRNSYGARCLNTPNVLFADIDFTEQGATSTKFLVFLLLAVPGVVVAWLVNMPIIAIVEVVLAAILAGPIVNLVRRARTSAAGGAAEQVRARLQTFLEKNPKWNVRIYRTPAGMRLLATHALIEPTDDKVKEFFDAVGADPIYVRMCFNQKCFRARISAKPWRIGINAHMKPNPGVWPVKPERIPERKRWIEAYEKKAKEFAACTFVDEMGSGGSHSKVLSVIRLHDQECRANAGGMALA